MMFILTIHMERAKQVSHNTAGEQEWYVPTPPRRYRRARRAGIQSILIDSKTRAR